MSEVEQSTDLSPIVSPLPGLGRGHAKASRGRSGEPASRSRLADLWQRRAAHLNRKGRIEAAASAQRRAVALQLTQEGLLRLASLALKICDEALERSALTRAAELRPLPIQLQLRLAELLGKAGRHADAVAAVESAAEAHPSHAPCWAALGALRRHLGETESAQAAFARALELSPDDVRLLRVHGYDHTFTRQDPAFGRVLKAAADAQSRTPAERVDLHYAAAKAFEDIGEAETAFEHYAAAGRLQTTLSPWSDEPMRRVLDVFRTKLPRPRPELGCPSDRPVFIVGLPRSGTSLVEQILASHPSAFGAGETRLLAETLNGCRLGGAIIRTTAGKRPAPSWTISSRSLSERGRRYTAALEARAPTHATRIVDKMPHNFYWVGLIDAMLPNSHIVHCRRHPLDVCLSLYRLHFGAEVPYAYDFADLAKAYRLYRDFMRLWSEALPAGRIIDLTYESLVRSPEREIGRLLGRLDLPWDQRCLAPERTPRAVATASATQVRQPIRTDTIGRWKQCERFLAPLAEDLAEEVAEYERAA